MDYRTLPRSTHRSFDHDRARYCIMRDWLGEGCLFFESEFKRHFMVSRARFEMISRRLVASDPKFYAENRSANKVPVASTQAKILIGLKSISHGVCPATFADYFQMSETLAIQCREKLTEDMVACFKEDYLHLMTPADAKSVTKLHEYMHGVDGIAGSIDCMHYDWLKCPKAWQGVFKRGDQKYASLVLEAACDYNLYFWHVNFGHPGTYNDISVLHLSSLYEAFVDGSMEALDVSAMIGGELFKILAYLVDGIYPPLNRFVPGVSCPTTSILKCFTGWQESKRKDIERAFGVFQARCGALAVPLRIHSLEKIGSLVECCLIIHNMAVQERVMGNCVNKYNPSNGIYTDPITPEEVSVDATEGTLEERKARKKYEESQIGFRKLDGEEQQLFTNKWKSCLAKTNDVTEHYRLRDAVACEVYKKRNRKHRRPKY